MAIKMWKKQNKTELASKRDAQRVGECGERGEWKRAHNFYFSSSSSNVNGNNDAVCCCVLRVCDLKTAFDTRGNGNEFPPWPPPPTQSPSYSLSTAHACTLCHSSAPACRLLHPLLLCVRGTRFYFSCSFLAELQGQRGRNVTWPSRGCKSVAVAAAVASLWQRQWALCKICGSAHSTN